MPSKRPKTYWRFVFWMIRNYPGMIAYMIIVAELVMWAFSVLRDLRIVVTGAGFVIGSAVIWWGPIIAKVEEEEEEED